MSVPAPSAAPIARAGVVTDVPKCNPPATFDYSKYMGNSAKAPVAPHPDDTIDLTERYKRTDDTDMKVISSDRYEFYVHTHMMDWRCPNLKRHDVFVDGKLQFITLSENGKVVSKYLDWVYERDWPPAPKFSTDANPGRAAARELIVLSEVLPVPTKYSHLLDKSTEDRAMQQRVYERGEAIIDGLPQKMGSLCSCMYHSGKGRLLEGFIAHLTSRIYALDQIKEKARKAVLQQLKDLEATAFNDEETRMFARVGEWLTDVFANEPVLQEEQRSGASAVGEEYADGIASVENDEPLLPKDSASGANTVDDESTKEATPAENDDPVLQREKRSRGITADEEGAESLAPAENNAPILEQKTASGASTAAEEGAESVERLENGEPALKKQKMSGGSTADDESMARGVSTKEKRCICDKSRHVTHALVECKGCGEWRHPGCVGKSHYSANMYAGRRKHTQQKDWYYYQGIDFFCGCEDLEI